MIQEILIASTVILNVLYMAGLWYFGSGWKDNRD